MRASKFFIATLKNAPSDAEITSHKLMARAGLVKQLSSGIYTYMPIGLRTIRKIEKIIREEMNRAGAIELLMPIIQPAELWKKTERWKKMGSELMRIKDRYNRCFIVQPTSEEVITNIVSTELQSYKQLPVNFYHIQTKFRDEKRPRFGLIRAREFIMKDAYSFDRDIHGLKTSYEIMYNAYINIFNRLNLQFRVVTANNGDIGGSSSHEFHIITSTGEDTLAYCPTSDYAANIELAQAAKNHIVRKQATENLKKIEISHLKQDQNKIQTIHTQFINTIKSIVLINNNKKTWLLLLRADHKLNETKVRTILGLEYYHFASEEEILEQFGVPSKYLGPIGIHESINVIADHTVANMSDFTCGANEINFYFTGVNWGRDLPEPIIADIRNIVVGDPSPDGKGILATQQGIEIGHIFQLGTTYSKKMQATFIDKNGKLKFLQMGCYGIGITRILSAAIEQKHDTKGIVWPTSLAPFSIVLCPIGYFDSPLVKLTIHDLHKKLLQAHIDVILDDRHERLGVMLADWELIGIPHRIIVSNRSIQNNQIEYQGRQDFTATMVNLSDVLSFIKKKMV